MPSSPSPRLNLPVLLGEALATAREDFNQLLLERTVRAHKSGASCFMKYVSDH